MRRQQVARRPAIAYRRTAPHTLMDSLMASFLTNHASFVIRSKAPAPAGWTRPRAGIHQPPPPLVDPDLRCSFCGTPVGPDNPVWADYFRQEMTLCYMACHRPAPDPRRCLYPAKPIAPITTHRTTSPRVAIIQLMIWNFATTRKPMLGPPTRHTTPTRSRPTGSPASIPTV